MKSKDWILDRVAIDHDGCWEFTGAKNSDGYGCVNIEGRTVSAHRVAYELFVGSIPDDMSVLHSCDNRCCLNPEHLFLGTQYDNVRDMIAKERQNFNCKPPYLSDAKVAGVRRLLAKGYSLNQIAALFYVSPGVIFKVKHRQGCYK